MKPLLLNFTLIRLNILRGRHFQNMAHITGRKHYKELIERLNSNPQGAAPSDLLYKILKLFFTEKEASLVAKLPIKPFTIKKASKAWNLDLVSTHKVLDDLCSRALLVDIELYGKKEYVLPPPMAGFFEMSLMRVRNDINQKALSELFYQYLNVEDEFIPGLVAGGDTQLGRVFVNEDVLSEENIIQVLPYERAQEVIKTASHIGISMCYCRHKMMHVGKACDAPMDICMTFNTAAASVIKHGYARSVGSEECLDLLHEAWDNNLVQFGENIRTGVNFICNCCSCCCEAMVATKKFAGLNWIHTTNFIAGMNDKECSGCGKCIDVCPIDAIKLKTVINQAGRKKIKVAVDESLCLGCGICVRNCSLNALFLESRSQRVLTPLNTAHRWVLMAIERGTLQDLLFDNKVMMSHRLLAAFLGVVLKLPGINRMMALKQIKSRFLEKIMVRYPY
jgi:ferredoxin